MFKRFWLNLNWVFLLLLAVQFLTPQHILADMYLNSRMAQMGLCVVVALYALACWITIRKPGGSVTRLGMCVAGGVVGIVTYLGLLEAAQSLTADRHARWIDFLYNGTAVVAVGTLLFLLLCLLVLIERSDAAVQRQLYGDNS
jgi:hypothetical protein